MNSGYNPEDVIYFQTNDFHSNQNAILAYKLKGDGTISQIPGSPFLTGGTGVGNPMQILGPSDSDQELRKSDDGKFLLAVNSGSNTISVFRIGTNGNIIPVNGSPFSSYGQTPVSIDFKGKYVYVVNKSQDPQHTITQPPNYKVFTIDAKGKLTPSYLFPTTPGSSPAQALVSAGGKFLFGADFLGFQVGVGTLRSFVIDEITGKLTNAPNSPQAISGAGGALGLIQHPYANVLYVGFPVQAKVGVYEIDENTGKLTFKTAVDAGLAACWLRINRKGTRLYSLNSAENTISVFNTTSPKSPVSIQKFELKKPGPLFGTPPATTSEPFSFEFSSSQKYLVVLNQHTNPDFSVGNYNYLHILKISPDGKLSEPNDPTQVPVANTLRPKGVVVVPIIK